MRIDYYTYIRSPEWHKKADAAKLRAGYRCQVCNRPSREVQLDAHHRTYERLGHERPEDITVLCRRCHELYEKNGSLPSPPGVKAAHRTLHGKQLKSSNAETASDTKTKPTSTRHYTWKNSGFSGAGCGFMVAIVGIFVWLFVSVPPPPPPLPPPPDTPTSTATLTSMPTPSKTFIRTNLSLNVREGPGVQYTTLGYVLEGKEVEVVALEISDTGRKWYQLASGGWIYADVLNGKATVTIIGGSPTTVTPTRTPTPRLTPAPTRTPTSTPKPPTPTPSSSAHGCPGGCTTFPTWCAPPIKGNVSFDDGERIYHVPGQEYYDETKINPRYGERWFCTEAEARAAGWRKSKR